MAKLAVIAAAAVLHLSVARDVTLSNIALPNDNLGNMLLTGEATVLALAGTYYAYFNNWGGCPVRSSGGAR